MRISWCLATAPPSPVAQPYDSAHRAYPKHTDSWPASTTTSPFPWQPVLAPLFFFLVCFLISQLSSTLYFGYPLLCFYFCLGLVCNHHGYMGPLISAAAFIREKTGRAFWEGGMGRRLRRGRLPPAKWLAPCSGIVYEIWLGVGLRCSQKHMGEGQNGCARRSGLCLCLSAQAPRRRSFFAYSFRLSLPSTHLHESHEMTLWRLFQKLACFVTNYMLFSSTPTCYLRYPILTCMRRALTKPSHTVY